MNVSEVGVAEMLWFADTHSYAKVNCLYTFPTLEQLKKFIQIRLNTVLQASPYYSSIWNQRDDSLSRKRIRSSFLSFATSSSDKALESQKIDFLSFDEYDRVSPSAEGSGLQALKSSNFKMLRRWSTPSVSGVGVDKLYNQSDMFQYYHKCDRCNHSQVLDYHENIECVDKDGIDWMAKTVKEGSYRFICQKCKKPLDRWENGFWHAEYPQRTLNNHGVRGYAISQLSFVGVTASQLVADELNSYSKGQFYNYSLGKVYNESSLSVTPQDMINTKREYLPQPLFKRGKYKHIAVGLDWGEHHWFCVYGFQYDGRIDIIRLHAVQQSRGVHNIEKDLREIIMVLTPYDPDIIVADSRGMGDYVWKLMNHFGKNIVYNGVINSTPRSNGMTEPKWNENESSVKIDKLTENKKMISDIHKQLIGTYTVDDDYMKLFTTHWGNVIIKEEVDPNTKEVYQVITRRGDDHLSQASVYGMIGMRHILEQYRPGGEDNAFNYTNIGDLPQPTKPDIFTRGH